jgi:hypothetical protein
VVGSDPSALLFCILRAAESYKRLPFVGGWQAFADGCSGGQGFIVGKMLAFLFCLL